MKLKRQQFSIKVFCFSIFLISSVGLVVEDANAASDMSLSRVRECFDLADDMDRERRTIRKFKKDVVNLGKGYENANDAYRPIARAMYNGKVHSYKNKLSVLNNELIPNYNRKCGRKDISRDTYQQVCNSKEKLKNSFCKGAPKSVKKQSPGHLRYHARRVD